MSDRSTRSLLTRGIVMLAVLVVAAGAIGPATSAAKLTKGRVRMIAKKILNKNIETVGDPLFLGEGELDRFHATLQTGGQQPLATHGPFTFTAQCLLDTGNVEARIEVTTSEANSSFYSTGQGAEGDFDPSDPGAPILWLAHLGGPPGSDASMSRGEQMNAIAPSGRTVQGTASSVTNQGSTHCTLEGYVLSTNPVV